MTPKYSLVVVEAWWRIFLWKINKEVNKSRNKQAKNKLTDSSGSHSWNMCQYIMNLFLKSVFKSKRGWAYKQHILIPWSPYCTSLQENMLRTIYWASTNSISVLRSSFRLLAKLWDGAWEKKNEVKNTLF